ncbi:MAG: lipocalin family protein [Sulfuricaulis sp.]
MVDDEHRRSDWSVKGIAYGLLLIVTLFVAGSVSAADYPNDARYKKGILGNWQEQDVLETGVTLQKQFSFTSDSKFWVSVKRTDGSTISSYRTEGTWTIENEALTINIVNS